MIDTSVTSLILVIKSSGGRSENCSDKFNALRHRSYRRMLHQFPKSCWLRLAKALSGNDTSH